MRWQPRPSPSPFVDTDADPAHRSYRFHLVALEPTRAKSSLNLVLSRQLNTVIPAIDYVSMRSGYDVLLSWLQK
jgi:hypothetical protein